MTVDLGFMDHVPLAALATRLAGGRRARLGIGRYRQEDLVLVKELVDSGKYRPVIDRAYELDDIVEATLRRARPEDRQPRPARERRDRLEQPGARSTSQAAGRPA